MTVSAWLWRSPIGSSSRSAIWSRGEIELTVEGEGRNELTEDRDNRFVRGLEAALVKARGKLPDGVGWRIAMHNQIPLSRGLGSSAAATVAGVLAGNALAGEPLSTSEMLRLASDIEGHPDNAAASLLGGFVVSAASPEGVEAIRFASPRDLRAVLFIPELRLRDQGDARSSAGHRCLWQMRSPILVPWRSGSPGWRPGATTCWRD